MILFLCLHRFSVILLVCCCVAAQTDGDVARRRQDYHPDEEDGHSPGSEAVTEVYDETTISELGLYLGSPCELSCDARLSHVFCDRSTGLCDCEKKFPVRLGATTGCAKAVRLGDQCLYGQTCTFTDQFAECTQINHNAICQCKPGYHSVSLQRPTKRIFCSPDQVILTTDLRALFGVAAGLSIFGALMCFVLKLFSRARYSRPRHYANANLAPPILFSSETGIPLAVHAGRPSSRASSQRSVGTLASGFSRRPSSSGSRGVLVPASRAGSRRPSLASIHSSASSSRSMSFSMRKFERENQQREARREQLMQDTVRDGPAPAPTPSPRTPMSTDELLPSVSESKEEGHSMPVLSPPKGPLSSSYQGEIGPCTSSDSAH